MVKRYRLDIITNEKGLIKKELNEGFSPPELMGILEMVKLEKLKKIKLNKMEVNKNDC